MTLSRGASWFFCLQSADRPWPVILAFICGNLSDVESKVIPLNSKQRGTGMLLFVAHCSQNTKVYIAIMAMLTSPFGSPCNTWPDFVAAVQLSIH